MLVYQRVMSINRGRLSQETGGVVPPVASRSFRSSLLKGIWDEMVMGQKTPVPKLHTLGHSWKSWIEYDRVILPMVRIGNLTSIPKSPRLHGFHGLKYQL
jgi:hypothetical protein